MCREFDPQLVLLDIMLIFYIGYYIVIVRIYDKIVKLGANTDLPI